MAVPICPYSVTKPYKSLNIVLFFQKKQSDIAEWLPFTLSHIFLAVSNLGWKQPMFQTYTDYAVVPSPPPPVPPLVENASSQLQCSQTSRKVHAPLPSWITGFLVGQGYRKTNAHKCSISVGTSSDKVGWHICLNTCCDFGKRFNLIKRKRNRYLAISIIISVSFG